MATRNYRSVGQKTQQQQLILWDGNICNASLNGNRIRNSSSSLRLWKTRNQTGECPVVVLPPRQLKTVDSRPWRRQQSGTVSHWNPNNPFYAHINSDAFPTPGTKLQEEPIPRTAQTMLLISARPTMRCSGKLPRVQEWPSSTPPLFDDCTSAFLL